jgi:hypothetical protein
MSRINETLKKAIDDLDLDKRLNEAVEQAEEGLHRALQAAGGFAHEHRDDYERVVDRITATVLDRTDGSVTGSTRACTASRSDGPRRTRAPAPPTAPAATSPLAPRRPAGRGPRR